MPISEYQTKEFCGFLFITLGYNLNQNCVSSSFMIGNICASEDDCDNDDGDNDDGDNDDGDNDDGDNDDCDDGHLAA